MRRSQSNARFVTKVWRRSVVLVLQTWAAQKASAAPSSLPLDARGGNAVAFPCKATIPHLAPAIGKPFLNEKFKIKNAKWKTESRALRSSILHFTSLIFHSSVVVVLAAGHLRRGPLRLG